MPKIIKEGVVYSDGGQIVDTALDSTSTNPVENKAIATEINSIKSELTDIGTITNISLKSGTASGQGSTADISNQIALSKGKYMCCINLSKSYMLDIDFHIQALVNNVAIFANNGNVIFEVENNNTPFKIQMYNNGSGSKTFTPSAASNCNLIKINSQ